MKKIKVSSLQTPENLFNKIPHNLLIQLLSLFKKIIHYIIEIIYNINFIQ